MGTGENERLKSSRANHATLNIIHRSVGTWIETIDNRGHVARVFLDADDPILDPDQSTNDDYTVLTVYEEGTREPRPPHEVPPLGEQILRFVCRSDELEGMLGDLQENFQEQSEKYGATAAKRWYWWQVTRSAGAFALKLLGKVVAARELLRKFGL